MQLSTKKYYAGNTIEVERTASGILPGALRRPKVAQTAESVKKFNETLSIRKLIRTVNANFGYGDLYLTPTYRTEERPKDMKQLQADGRNFCRRLARAYKKAGAEFKYLLVCGIGKRGAPHLHLIVSGIDARRVSAAWKAGGIHIETLYKQQEHTALGMYFADQIKNYVSGDGWVSSKRWTCSRNVRPVEPEISKTEDFGEWSESPTADEGYIINAESVEAGVNPVSGYPYLFYRQIKAPKIRKAVITADGEVLSPKEAEAERRRVNAEEIRKVIEARLNYSEEVNYLKKVYGGLDVRL